MSIPIRSSKIIEFGKEITAISPEMLKLYGMYVYMDNEYITNTAGVVGGHSLAVQLEAVYSIFNSVREESYVLTSTSDSTLEMGFLNLGRLARLKLTGRGLEYIIKNFENELNRNRDGVVCTTKTATEPLANMYYVAGQALDSMIGSWNKVKYRPADDILAGVWMTFFDVMFWWTGHIMSIHFLWKQPAQFSVLDGILRGSYVNLNPVDENTWGSNLSSKENKELDNHSTPTWKTTGKDIFGLDVTTVDSSEFRKVDIAIYTHAVAFWQRLLSKTRWEWKYGKWIEVQPLFSLWNPETSTDGAVMDDWDDYFGISNVTGKNQWSAFVQRLNLVTTELKNFRFTSDSFGKLKTLVNLIPFSNVPDLTTGPGGVIMHQMTFWNQGGALDTDDMYMKTYVDVDSDYAGHTVLALRRDTDNLNDIITLGEMELRDYRLLHYFSSFEIWDEDLESVEEIHSAAIPRLDIKSMFGFAITKSENKPYMISRLIHDLVGGANVTSSIGDTNPLQPKTWQMFNDITPNERSTEFTIGMNYVAHGYYYWRASDPYKKIAHNVHDVNNLDLELVLRDVVTAMMPGGTSQISLSTSTAKDLISSAMPVPDAVESAKPDVIPASAMPADLKEKIEKEKDEKVTQ